jgi:hypothetical protein
MSGLIFFVENTVEKLTYNYSIAQGTIDYDSSLSMIKKHWLFLPLPIEI